MIMNEKNYLIIQGWMIKAFPDITFQELGVYALIYGFSQDGQNEYTLGYDYVMEMCKLSRRDVAKRIICRLVDKGYLTKSIFSINGREFENFKAVIPPKVEVSTESGGSTSKVDYKININNTPNNPTLFNNKDSVISPNGSKQVKSISERKAEFHESLRPYLQEYGEDMIIDFFNYWVEENQSGTKMRFEMERVFELKRRLITWKRKEEERKFGRK